MIWNTDRTAILTNQKCPRERFYSRHFNSQGIERIKKSLPLVFGSAFHEAAEDLLTGKGVESAVARALSYLDAKFAESGVDMQDENATTEAAITYGMNEQKAIAEGLTRAWWIAQGKRFLEDFEIIEIEKEGRGDLGNDVTLMFRSDGRVREKATGDQYLLSWKTTSSFGKKTIDQINCDMQSMSEVWGTVQEGNGPIEGVLYLFAEKGQRKFNKYVGWKTQNTHLAYGWVRKGPTRDDDEWSWAYEYENDEGKNTRLGKGFYKASIWDNYEGGVKAWIEALAAQEITPRHINALEGVFPQSLPVSRRADEIESWRRQVVAQEERIRNAVRIVELAGETGGDVDAALDKVFPQHTANCYSFNSKCSMFDICFNPAVKADPLNSGLYQVRISNHPEKGDGDE